MHENDSSLTDWEAVCRRCGRCCFEKIEFGGVVYYTDIPCERLDPVTRLCSVYPEREQVRPGCVRLDPHMVRRGYLPADCPYVANLEDYPAPLPWRGAAG